jgi:glucosyl-dolichyl phosphate glucuronosyltransferase
MPLFSAVICTYNRYDVLPRAIESLRQQNFAGSYDIWVMDNSPSSDARTASAQHYSGIPNLNYAQIDRPGLSNARNLAAQTATGEYIIYLDDDATAYPDLLQAYSVAFNALGARVGAIGGKVIPDYAIPKPSWLDDRLLTYLSLCDFGDVTKILEGSDEPVGANIAFRKTALMQSGGFNPSLGRIGFEGHSLLSGEESDCVRRMKSLGFNLGYAPRATATHSIPASRLTHAWFRRRSAWQSTSDQMQYTLHDHAISVFKASIEHYVKQVPADHAATMGFMWDTDNAELFFRQINAIGMFTRLMLAKGSI